MLLPLIVLMIAPVAEPNEAEKLFREMEAKVSKAKSIECAYEFKVEFGKEKGSDKGTVFLDDGNKVRIESNRERAGEKEKFTSVSDGEKGVLGVEKKSPPLQVPKYVPLAVRAAITRAGLLEPGFVVQASGEKYERKFDINEEFPVSDFKLGKKEKVGDHDAQVVEYTVKKGDKIRLAVSVWLDTKTNLPLKRFLIGTWGGQKVTIDETFTRLSLDGKIDPKKFELPK